jgi:integrase
VAGKRKAINFGWASEGWTEARVWEKLNLYKNNAKTGTGPTSLKEERQIEEAKKEYEKEKALLEQKDKISFSDFFDGEYLPVSKTNKKPESWRKEVEHFKNWLEPELGLLPMKQIAPFNIEKLKKQMLRKGRSPRTIQYCLATFRQCWNHARVIGLVKVDSPTKAVKIPKFDNKRLRFLTMAEAECLLNKLKDRSEQVYQLALLSLHTGARAGELFSLEWGNVDLPNEVLTVRDSKSGRTRYLYLTQQGKSVFENMASEVKTGDLVFKDKNGKKIGKISNTFTKTVEVLGLNNGVTDRRQKVIFHTLRHTFASWHVQNGTDLYTLKDLLGHHSITQTERYSHLRPDGLKKAAKMFDRNVAQGKVIQINKAENE